MEEREKECAEEREGERAERRFVCEIINEKGERNRV